MPACRFAAATRLRDSVPLAKLRLGTRQAAPPPAPAAPAPSLSWARLLALKLHCAPCTGVRLSCLNEVILVSLCGDSLSVVIFSVLKSLYRPFRERRFLYLVPAPSFPRDAAFDRGMRFSEAGYGCVVCFVLLYSLCRF